MAPNKYKWHLIILPEDDATRQIANGLSDSRDELENAVQVLKECRGWQHTLDDLADQNLQDYPERRVLLVIDFDKAEGRLDYIKKNELVQEFHDRVFVIGSKFEAEDLKRALGLKFNKLGEKLGKECSAWDTPLLADCKSEICRLKSDMEANLEG